MSAGRTLATRALLSGAILIGISSPACLAGEIKHDIQGLELGMPHRDALGKLKSMNCAAIDETNIPGVALGGRVECQNTDFGLAFAESLADSPLYEISASFRGSLTPEQQVKSVEQQFGVSLSRDRGDDRFVGSLGQDRTILLFNNDTLDGVSIHDWILVITDNQLQQDNEHTEKDQREHAAPQKF